jgi:hypothetical protein
MSGWFDFSHELTCSSRARIEFTFQLAILMIASLGAEAQQQPHYVIKHFGESGRRRQVRRA